MKRIVRIFICLVTLLAVSTSVAEGRGFNPFRKVKLPKNSYNMRIPGVSTGSRFNTHFGAVIGHGAIKAKQDIDREKINSQQKRINLQGPLNFQPQLQLHPEFKFEPTKKE